MPSDLKIGTWPVSAKMLIFVSVLTTLGFSLVCGSILLDMRRGEAALARQTLGNLASSIDSDISRNIDIYDLSLRAVAINMNEPEIISLSAPIRRLILFDHAATAQHYGAIQVLDADGNLSLDSSTLDPPLLNRADEEYFRVHRDNPNVGLFVSKPMLYRGEYAVILSRRISAHDGSFLGVVVGALRFSYFHDLFGRLKFSQNDSVTIFRRDGMVIMRHPFDLDVVGRDLSNVPGVQRTLSEQSGSEFRTSAVDNVERLYVWFDSGHPLVVSVGQSWNNVFALWWRQATKIAGIMLGLIGFVAAATLFLAREISRRARAEDRLEQLATTDALTGLKNRRRFDDAMAQAWSVSRHAESLALLMIDADHFKAFNDMFGHQAGDQLLKRIAGCIDAVVKRAGDCAARYGGEEFAILLPGLNALAAREIAEEIRARVEALSVEKWATTVSIGVAHVMPSAVLRPSDLLAAADKALYQAKADGRNRCVVALTDALREVA